MANFVSFVSNKFQRILAIASSVGAGDADKIIATDSNGKIDSSLVDESANLNTISSTQGTVLFRDASTWSGLAPATAGFALTTGGAGANPSYAQIPVISDGALQFTPVASQTGLIPTYQMVAIQTAFTLANSAIAQNCLTAVNDTITLSGSTAYMVKGFYKIVTGATTHTTAMGFAGTATITNFEYFVLLSGSGANSITTTQSTVQVSGTASKVLNATAASSTISIQFEGILRINGAGTIIPQITFSANPTGACTMAIGSWISFTPLGTNTFQAIGNWS